MHGQKRGGAPSSPGPSAPPAAYRGQVLLGQPLALPALLDHLAHLQRDPVVVQLFGLPVQLGRVLGDRVLLVLPCGPCGGRSSGGGWGSGRGSEGLRPACPPPSREGAGAARSPAGDTYTFWRSPRLRLASEPSPPPEEQRERYRPARPRKEPLPASFLPWPAGGGLRPGRAMGRGRGRGSPARSKGRPRRGSCPRAVALPPGRSRPPRAGGRPRPVRPCERSPCK